MALGRCAIRRLIACVGVFALFLCARASFATEWDGGGVDNLWSTPGNWANNTAPVNNDPLVFDGSLRLDHRHTF